MAKIVVDTRGKLCPLPLIMLKRSILDNPVGTTFTVLTDNEISCSNLNDFIADGGYETVEEDHGDYTSITFTATSKPAAQENTDQVVRAASGKRVVKFKSDRMGEGDPKLGEILVRAFLNTIPELDPLPTHIVCYNGGVHLACEGTDTAETLKKLHEENGIEIIVCGTCVDFYGVKDKIAVGKISNMYSIAQLLTDADHTIEP